MATLTITIPDAEFTRVADKFALRNNYQPMISSGGAMIPNPETKAQFMKASVITFIRNSVRNQEAADAAKQAADNANTQPDPVIT